jgi:hypothetical protein
VAVERDSEQVEREVTTNLQGQAVLEIQGLLPQQIAEQAAVVAADDQIPHLILALVEPVAPVKLSLCTSQHLKGSL